MLRTRVLVAQSAADDVAVVNVVAPVPLPLVNFARKTSKLPGQAPFDIDVAATAAAAAAAVATAAAAAKAKRTCCYARYEDVTAVTVAIVVVAGLSLAV